MNFIIPEMTFLKYFIPLIEEGNKMGIKSSLFSWNINKYNSISNNVKEFNKLLEAYNFNFYGIEETNDIFSFIWYRLCRDVS